MHQPGVLIADQPNRSSEYSTTEKYCIFRSADQWFAVPATSVREVTIARDIVSVPPCHRVLAGICHLRGSFLPVISLHGLLPLDSAAPSQPHHQLMVISDPAPWALLIAEAAAVDSLQQHVKPEDPLADPLQALTAGTALYGNQLVHMLDPVRLLRHARQIIDDDWCVPRDLRQSYQANAGGEN